MALQMIANLLSIITIAICFVLKIPQILTLFSVKSVRGISIVGLMLELTSYTVMTSYNYTNGYPLLSYMEYPVILSEELVLIYFFLKYDNRMNSRTVYFTVCYFIIGTCLMLEVIPKTVITILATMCTPISATSKIIQLAAICRAQDAKSVSLLTWLISALTNMTRIFTIWVDSADAFLLGNFIISTALSSSIVCAIVYFNKSRLNEDNKKSPEEKSHKN